jgi:hypothetical protein
MPTTPVHCATRQTLAWQAVPRRVGLAFLAVLILGLAFGPPAEAAEPCDVPGEYASIQLALADNACATINVAAGGFAGPIMINRKVTIRGAGQELTFFDGLFLHQVVTIGPAATAEITGVTIQGGFTNREGGGINSGCCIRGEDVLCTPMHSEHVAHRDAHLPVRCPSLR